MAAIGEEWVMGEIGEGEKESVTMVDIWIWVMVTGGCTHVNTPEALDQDLCI